MKKIFVVFVIEENEKYYAFADTIKTGENLIYHCNRYAAKLCHLCESRKEADTLAITWNNQYFNNGTYLFQ